MSLVRFDLRGAVGVITLDRPPVNALSGELVADLAVAISDAADPGVRAVVVTGSPHFAAGADIAGFKRLMESGGSGAELGVHLGETLARLEALPKPIVAAVRGYALGGGLELAMACDLRMLSESAKVGQPEVKLGVIPGAGGTQRLPRLVGIGRARDIVYTGRMVDAAEAHRIGLADRVVPDASLDEAALAWAQELADSATAAIAAAKRVMAGGWDGSLSEGLALEAEGFRGVRHCRRPRRGERLPREAASPFQRSVIRRSGWRGGGDCAAKWRRAPGGRARHRPGHRGTRETGCLLPSGSGCPHRWVPARNGPSPRTDDVLYPAGDPHPRPPPQRGAPAPRRPCRGRRP